MLISKKDLDIRDSEPPCVLLGLEGLSQFRQNALPSSETIAMVNEKGRTVNTSHLTNEEIMIPYNRVVYIAWDKDVGIRFKELRVAKGVSQQGLAELTLSNPDEAVSEDMIASLEQGRKKSVSRKILDTLLGKLGYDVTYLFPSVAVKNF